jgi:predicted O-methyltransferase YrrM
VHVPETPIPFVPATTDWLRSRLDSGDALPFAPPTLAVLDERWANVRDVIKRLKRVNSRYDKYLDLRRLGAARAAGMRTSKDLFVSWLAENAPPRRVLEIGCRTGRSLSVLLDAHPNPGDCAVVLIDPFIEMGSPDSVVANLRKLGVATTPLVLVGRSDRLLRELPDSAPDARFDYILVDGSHRKEDALADLKSVAPLVAPGGCVVFDDLGPGGYDLLTVWEEWLGTDDRFTATTHLEPHSFGVATARSA